MGESKLSYSIDKRAAEMVIYCYLLTTSRQLPDFQAAFWRAYPRVIYRGAISELGYPLTPGTEDSDILASTANPSELAQNSLPVEPVA